jgi:hypothetical protein
MAVVLLSLLLILGCVFVLVYPKSNQHKKTESASKYVESGNIKDVSYWGDNKEYILAKDFYFVGNRYLVSFNYNETQDNNNLQKENTGFRYYDISRDMAETKVNFIKDIRKKFPKAYSKNFDVINNKGQSLVWLRYYESKDSEKSYELFYDLDHHKFIDPENIDTEVTTIDAILTSYTNLGGLVVKKSGYRIGSRIELNGYRDKNSVNLNIFKEHPELKEKLSKEGYTLYPRQDSISNAEYFDQLLHWFAPTGQDRITGVKIDAYYSKDGQEHEIHSYEEFKQYIMEKVANFRTESSHIENRNRKE